MTRNKIRNPSIPVNTVFLKTCLTYNLIEKVQNMIKIVSLQVIGNSEFSYSYRILRGEVTYHI